MKNTMNPLPALACAALLGWATGTPAQSLRPTLDLASARQIAQACESYATQQGWHMAMALNDDAGRLKHFSRMDGAALISIAAAQIKADTSSGLPLSTRQYRAAARQNEGAERLPGITTVAGGLPIIDAAGALLGSIGVSGGSEDQDEACAQAGLNAVQAILSRKQ